MKVCQRCSWGIKTKWNVKAQNEGHPHQFVDVEHQIWSTWLNLIALDTPQAYTQLIQPTCMMHDTLCMMHAACSIGCVILL